LDLSPHEITRLLDRWGKGDREALAELMPLVYAELHDLAEAYLRRERSDHTLQATALVHEAYLRLRDERGVTWKSRGHFFGVAAQLMRFILVNHAKARGREKRGGGARRVALDDALLAYEESRVDVLDLDDALRRLEGFDSRQSRIVELRFFAGLSVEETAEALELSSATVKREWSVARAWLHGQLRPSPPPSRAP